MRHHPYARCTIEGIPLRKPCNVDYTQAKSYRKISILKNLVKVAKKVVVELISD